MLEGFIASLTVTEVHDLIEGLNEVQIKAFVLGQEFPSLSISPG